MRALQPITVAALVAALAAPLFAQSENTESGSAPPAKPDAQLVAAPEDRRAGFESIDPELCREWLSYLASDELGGRGTGTPGYRKAAEYVAARFKEFGLEPVGDDGTYFQAVPFESVGANEQTSYLAVLGGDGEELTRVAVGEGLGGRISANSKRELELVYLHAASKDDVAKADLEGKAVLFVDKSPRSRRGTEASMAMWRARPAAIITIDEAGSASVTRRIGPSGRGTRAFSGRRMRPNTYTVSEAVGETMRQAAEAHGSKAKLKTHIEIERNPVFAANVVGFLEGSDPQLKHEIVGIGSHLDHIGTRGDVINNGADDDGSGTTGVLAVARAFTKNPTKPRRSILFMCFAGEEMGLIGSRYYVNNPLFPNENMVAELQMDMIGRNEEFVDRNGEVREKAEENLNSLHLVGTEKLSKDLHEMCLAINDAHVGFDYEYDEEDVFSRSDHANFARKDIPIAFFFTGFHPQYHRPDDTVDKIDFPKLARVAKLVYLIGFEVAQREERIVRDRTWSEIPRRR